MSSNYEYWKIQSSSSNHEPWWKKALVWIILPPLYLLWLSIVGLLIYGAFYIVLLVIGFVFGKFSSGSF